MATEVASDGVSCHPTALAGGRLKRIVGFFASCPPG
jgi:hypothetical protein